MHKALWLGFDLGVRGDYEGLYAWLDAHQAKDCGDSLAYLEYEYSNALEDELTQELRAAVTVSKNTRIYVIWHDDDGRIRGRFLLGGRKSAPWSGYAGAIPAEVDEA